LPSLFEARRRLLTSATALTTCGQPNPDSLGSSQGRRPRPPSFSYESRTLPCGSGDPRRAALRSFVKTPVLVPLTCVSLPNRDAHSNAPPPRVASAEHSEDQRARVEGPSEGRVPCSLATISRACDGCMRFVAHADGVPLLGVLRTSAVIGAFACSEEPPHAKRTDLGLPSDDAPRRVPPSRRPGCLGPPRHAKEHARGEINLSGLRADSLAHAAHTLNPHRGQCCLIGHCEVTVRSPAGP